MQDAQCLLVIIGRTRKLVDDGVRESGLILAGVVPGADPARLQWRPSVPPLTRPGPYGTVIDRCVSVKPTSNRAGLLTVAVRV